MADIPKVKILDVPMYCGSLTNAVELVIAGCSETEERRNFRVSATGAHGLVLSRENTEFKKVLSTNFLNLPDGMPCVWIGRIKGKKKMERGYGPDFFGAVMRESVNKPIRHFLCGGKDGVAEELKTICKKKMGNTNIAGCFSPPFRNMSDDELRVIAEKINNEKTDILWIGMSTPKQEIFAARIADFVKVHFIVTVGAAFDFYTGRVKQAPRFMQRIGLEWLFRLYTEPRRLFGRYMKTVPLFAYYSIMELLINNKE